MATHASIPASSDTLSARRGSLAWRLILPTVIALLVALALIWLTVPQLMQSMAISDAALADRAIAANLQRIRLYYAENVVEKVVKSGALRADIDHVGDDRVIPQPVTMLHDLTASFSNRNRSVALFSKYPFPGRARTLDAFQQQAWDYLVAHPKDTFTRTEMREGIPYVRVAIADQMTSETCIRCHNSEPRSPKKDWKLGDVRGVLEVSSSIGAQLVHADTLSRWMTLGTAVIGALLLLFIGLATRSVTRPLSGMIRDMGKLAVGDFALVLPGHGRRDEIGAMAEAVERFKLKALERARQDAQEQEAGRRAAAVQRQSELHRLADSFQSAVSTMVEAVNSLSQQLEGASHTLAGTADSTRKLSDSVAGASQEASCNVQSVSQATQEFTNSVSEISQSAHESSRIAGEAVKQAQQTDARINALSKAASRIGNVVKLITDIAEQTNLLALNATIEAARAGDAGRGFAVVASEVKTLATQTARATEDIRSLIAEMQGATGESVAAIKEIVSTIGRLSEIATAIAVAVEEQSAATREIARNVDHAAQSTARVASNIGDVNRAASETSNASGQVLASAKVLAGEGAKFQLTVEKFLATVRAA